MAIGPIGSDNWDLDYNYTTLTACHEQLRLEELKKKDIISIDFEPLNH